MQVERIAECSKGSIVQYVRPSLSYHLSLRSLFCLFLSGRLRQVLLYLHAFPLYQRTQCPKYPRFCFIFTDGLNAECDFDSLREKKYIVTKFHNFDIERSLTGVADMSFKYDDLHGLKALIEEGKCFQTLDQLCQPWIQLLFDFDDNIIKDQTSADWSWDHIHSCTCLRYRTPLSGNFTSSIHRYSSKLLVFCFLFKP